MASHKPIGEFDVIHQIRDIVGPRYGDDVLIGIGDDAAAYRIAGDTAHVIATDALVEGEHFDRAFYLLEDVGYKAMAVNLSDIAAMNATPEYATIALGMPAGTSLQDIAAVYEGLNECARHYGVRIVGGDTVRAPLLMLSITVVGATPIEKLAIRGGARPGDLLCVTGTLGAGKAGLDVLRRETSDGKRWDVSGRDAVVQHHLRPRPRLDMVEVWAECGISPRACIDISDGLAAEVHHLCAASQCGAVVHTSALPISEPLRSIAAALGASATTLALTGGDDYELLYAVAPQEAQRMAPEAGTVLGQFTPADGGVRLIDSAGESQPLPAAGHDHFAGS